MSDGENEFAPDSSTEPVDISRLDSDLALFASVQKHLEDLRQRRPEAAEGRRAWGKFYLRYRRVVEVFIRSCGVPPQDVPDCKQEVWTAIIEHFRQFRHPGGGSYFRGWLYRVVQSKAIDIMRKRTAHRTVSLTDSVLNRESRAKDNWPDLGARLDEKWRQAIVQVALQELESKRGEQAARVVVMRVMEGRSSEEVGTTLKLTPGNVRVIQHRAHEDLWSIISRYTDEPLL